jgi:hypothetical protein
MFECSAPRGESYWLGGRSGEAPPSAGARAASSRLVGCRQITVTFKSLQGRLVFTVVLSEDGHVESRSPITGITG